MNYIYILECVDGSYYTGWTNNLEKRVCDHNEKRGAKYTRGRTPVKLVYYETFDTKSEAMKREAEIKKMDRRKKRALIEKQNKEIYENN
ncbi:MAG: GIY-YIG nuclease family protein [Lachnospiraceae bacterium]|nr:GIY-YIG nuclease family protein [Lachnospiraceae bacterium]